METIPPIRNLMPIILNPSPSSLSEMTLVLIQMQNIPNATSINPAAKSGLNGLIDSPVDLTLREYIERLPLYCIYVSNL